jgi:hypothetical protein
LRFLFPLLRFIDGKSETAAHFAVALAPKAAIGQRLRQRAVSMFEPQAKHAHYCM